MSVIKRQSFQKGAPIEMASHIPVLVEEAVELLHVQPGGHYIDCTVGAGGHAAAILERILPEGQLLGIDADPAAIEVAESRLQSYGDAVLLVNENFEKLEAICVRHNFTPVHGILFDLGMSSLQLEDKNRGFSFKHDAPLDMRFGPAQRLTAADIVNTFSEAELASLLWRYSDERRSRRIARQIVVNRPISTTSQLARIVEQAAGRHRGRIHPATRTFQALRIAVNQELEHLELVLKQAVKLLSPKGRLVLISYHSLEDRIVKRFLYRESRGCLCPPETPVCICGHVPTLKLITKRVITPSAAEIEINPRSRSAKLRAAELL
jgi:16S rRNA (cytosine1402-N4)-methyltransferase